MLNGCPECDGLIDVSAVRPYERITCPYCNKTIRVRSTFNHFTITSEIGEGGMSRVFRAQDNTLGREVALKILHSHYGDNPNLLAQFEQEARITASITHPNVVQVYSVGRDQGYFYIAMELLDGASLDQLIINHGGLSEVDAIRMVHGVTQGLAAAYEKGLIHRDIKPGNILVDQAGTAKLVDFGLALVQGTEEDANAEMWATPFYVPPEKLRRNRKEDFRSDIYSLGATLFHALAGRPPHDAHTNSTDELLAIKARPVDLKGAAPKVSDDTVNLVHKMMAKIPDQRQSSYSQLLAESSKVRAKIDPDYTAPSDAGGVPLWVKVAGGLIGAGALGALVLLVTSMTKQETADFGDDLIDFGTTEDTVVSTADLKYIEDFSKAQNDLLSGDMATAKPVFAEIAGMERARGDIRAWSIFHLGLTQLLEQNLSGAKESFAQIDTVADNLAKDDLAFLKHCSTNMAADGPVKFGVKEEAGHRPLGSLVYGLKNWLLDDFKGARRFLDDYATAKAEEEENYVELIANYRADSKTLAGVPARPGNEALLPDLESYVKALDGLASELKTQPAKDYLAGLLAKVEPKIQEMQIAMRQQREEEERKSFALIKGQVRELLAERKFAEGEEVLNDLKLDTRAKQQQAALLKSAVTDAKTFYDTFISDVGSMGYEGQILRADPSKPAFNAKIVAINGEHIMVDLGFGPTKLDLADISSMGILNIAQDTILRRGDEELKQGATIFAYMTGQVLLADQWAQDLSDSPGFTEKWELINAPE